MKKTCVLLATATLLSACGNEMMPSVQDQKIKEPYAHRFQYMADCTPYQISEGKCRPNCLMSQYHDKQMKMDRDHRDMSEKKKHHRSRY